MQAWKYDNPIFHPFQVNCARLWSRKLTLHKKWTVYYSLNFLNFCREFNQQSCDWFYSQVKSKCADFRSAKVIRSVGFSHTTDEVMNEVRSHIEKLVETLVGENIDESSVLKLSENSSCKALSSFAIIQWYFYWLFFSLQTTVSFYCFTETWVMPWRN